MLSNSNIKSNILFVPENEQISNVVRMMIDQNLSSVLIQDKNDYVIGIVTERDIVRKFTLLDMTDKLERTINTIMNRPVLFADVNNIDADVTRLHREKKLRHFPVLQGSDPKTHNVVGMISLSDMARKYMNILDFDGGPEELPKHGYPLRIISAIEEQFTQLEKIFSSLGYNVSALTEERKFPLNTGVLPGLIFDLDGFDKHVLHKWLKLIKNYQGPVVMACSNPSIVASFRTFLDKSRRIAIKPLDISFADWWFSSMMSKNRKSKK